jgi:hypothetical protein
MTKSKLIGLIVGGLIGLMLVACSPKATPAPTAQPADLPACSVVIGKDATTWTGVFRALGKDIAKDNPNFIVNGEIQTKDHDLQPDDFVVLEKPVKCDSVNGAYTSAMQVNFGKVMEDPRSTTAWWREVNGFNKGIITEQRVSNAFLGVCKDTRWGYQNQKLGFNDDLKTGGCEYPTFVKISWTNAAPTCERYTSMYEAYNALKSMKLSDIRWFVALSVGNTDINYCEQQ